VSSDWFGWFVVVALVMLVALMDKLFAVLLRW
jgi:hypothetical protein